VSERFLGCYARRFTAPISAFKAIMGTLPAQWSRLDKDGVKRISAEPWKPKDPNKVVTGFEYEMESYGRNVVARYLEVAGISADKLKKAETPFLDEAKDPSGVEYNSSSTTAATLALGSGIRSIFTGGEVAAVTVAKWYQCPTCGTAKKKSPVKPGAGFHGVEGELNRAAASIGMACLYGARLCRHDLLRAITRLAEQFHKWTPLSTRKLHRMMEYYNHTTSYKQYAFIGDLWRDLEVAVFVDADWASDRSDYKSTTGGMLVLIGPNSFFPVAFMSQKQGSVSASTPEAEVVALLQMLKSLGVPSMDFMDNEATQKILKMEKLRRP